MFSNKDVTGIFSYSNSGKVLADHLDEEDKGILPQNRSIKFSYVLIKCILR